MQKYLPFLSWLPIAKKYWKDDFFAAVTITIIAIPQAIAFAMIAGLPPIYGFYTAIAIPIVAALFGSSHHLISGPTTAISIIILGSVSTIVSPDNVKEYVTLTLLLTFLAGAIQFLMGVLRLGKLVNLISSTVLIGFTSGIGIIIAIKQLKYIFGLNMPVGTSLKNIVLLIVKNYSDINPYTLLVAFFTIFIALFFKLKIKKLSKFSMLIAIVSGSIFTYFLGSDIHHIDTIPAIKTNFSSVFQIPEFSLKNIKLLLPSAFIIAIIGLVKSIAIAKSIAIQGHQIINTNQEFIGQGLANMFGSFFSAYAGDGSLTRSKVNIDTGAKSPMSSIFSAIGLLVVLIFGAKYFAFLPKAAMGGVILLVGISLIDLAFFKEVFKSCKKEFVILLSSFLATLFLPLEYALLVGIVLSLLFYFYFVITVKNKTKLLNVTIHKQISKEHSEIKIVQIEGNIFYATIDKLTTFFSKLYENKELLLVIDLSKVNIIDYTGQQFLINQIHKFNATGGQIKVSNIEENIQLNPSDNTIVNALCTDSSQAINELLQLIK